MLQIGQFAALARVTVRTLRHYEDVGLLVPALVDPDSGYRYYTLSQLPRIHRILALREVGIALPRIREVLDEPLGELTDLELIEHQITSVQRSIRQERRRLSLLKTRLALAREDAAPPVLDIRVVDSPPQLCIRAAYTADTATDLWPLGTEASRRIYELLGTRGIAPAGPQVVRYLVEDFRERNIPTEILVPIPGGTSVSDLPDDLDLHTLRAVRQAAYTVYSGAFGQMTSTYRGIIRWFGMNNIHPDGYPREIQLSGQLHTLSWDVDAVVAVLIPFSRNP